MSDPYREVSPRREGHGLHPLAWVGIGLFAFFGLAFVGAIGMGIYVAKKVSHVVEEFEENPAAVVADVARRLDDRLEVVAVDESESVVTLRDRRTDRVLSVDLAELDAEGLVGLVNREGARVRFEGEAGEGGGFLTIRTPDGETRIELEGDEDGGRLVIRTPEGEAVFGAGADAEGLPDWVPLYPTGDGREAVFSARADGLSGGAVMLETPDGVGEILDWYRERLQADGFEVNVQRLTVNDEGIQGAVSAEDESGRKVNLLLFREGEGVTGLVVQYSRE